MTRGGSAFDLLRTLDIEDFLAVEGMDYRQGQGSRGAQFNVKECPACGNENWKVYLNAESGYGNCFVCNETFNKWTFIKAYLQSENNAVVGKYIEDAVKKLGYRPKPKREPVVQGKASEPLMPASLPLPTGNGSNAQYLEDRGVSSAYAAYFGLRLCRTGYHEYIGPDGDTLRQPFGNRILIPVYDLTGKFVTFQGRDITGKAERKYLFPSTLPGTSRFLLNGQNAMKAKAKHVLVGEGVFDVFAQKIAIDRHREMSGVVPVGTFGKHLSFGDGDTQLNAFARLKNQAGLETVTIMWDGEADALKSALDAAKHLKKLGLKVRIALLPKGKDPAEVESTVVRDCWLNATEYTPTMAVIMKIRNPYNIA